MSQIGGILIIRPTHGHSVTNRLARSHLHNLPKYLKIDRSILMKFSENLQRGLAFDPV